MQAWPAMDHISTEFGLITQAVLLLENKQAQTQLKALPTPRLSLPAWLQAYRVNHNTSYREHDASLFISWLTNTQVPLHLQRGTSGVCTGPYN